MTICRGTLENHCCWIGGEVCKYFDSSIINNKRCSLRSQVSSWNEVYSMQEYIIDILPTMQRLAENNNLPLTLCGEWPPEGVTCSSCTN